MKPLWAPAPLLLFLPIAFAQTNVLTSDYTNARTGANLAETRLQTSNITPGNFGLIGTFPVDGQVFGQPLYVSSLAIPGQGNRNVLYLATEHNTVYAYDADSAANPKLIWRTNVGASVPSSSVPNAAGDGPFIDVNPELGILSTPVIDLSTNVIYVVTETLTGNGPSFQLHALDLVNGSERMNGPVVITATYAVRGAAPSVFDPTQHLQRPGLLLANGAVHVAFGSHADFGLWHGWVASYDASDLSQQIGIFQTTADGNGGAIWQSGRGLAADDTGNVFFVTGNGDYDGLSNFSQSFVKLAGRDLTLSDWYTPANWQELSAGDMDLSAGPAILPDGSLIGGDKAGNVYLVNSGSMGRLDTGSAAQIVQAVGGWIFSLSVWARPDVSYVYLREKDGSLKQFRVAGGHFDPNPLSVSPPTAGTARVGMALSANGSQAGSGILWVTTGDYFDPTVPTTLHAFDASNLAHEIWNSDMNAADALNGFSKFASPTVANGTVFAVASNAVMAYGLVDGQAGSGDPPPVIANVQNSASFSGSVIAPGELITILGANLGSASPDSGGTEVWFDGVAAPLLFAGPNQVNAVVPFTLTSESVGIQVVYDDQQSDVFPMQVQKTAPGVFTADGSGAGQALAVHADGSGNSADNPAPRNSVVTIYATGAGVRPLLPVSATVGGLPAEVLYAGNSPGSVDGVLQINLVIPPNVDAGAAVPIVLTVGEGKSQDGVTLAVK